MERFWCRIGTQICGGDFVAFDRECTEAFGGSSFRGLERGVSTMRCRSFFCTGLVGMCEKERESERRKAR